MTDFSSFWIGVYKEAKAENKTKQLKELEEFYSKLEEKPEAKPTKTKEKKRVNTKR